MQTAQRLPSLGQWTTREELFALQEAQLPMAMGWAARSPFYKHHFEGRPLPRRLGELDDFPLTTKQDLRDNYPFGMLAVERSELATYHESSGTAGQPTPSYYTQADWLDLAQRFARKWIGILPSDTFLVRTPYALLLTGHLAQAAGSLEGATVVPGDNRSLAMPYARVVRVMRDLGVTLTWSVPTECLLWAAAARGAGLDPSEDFPSLRALFVGGEPLSQARRQRIASIWDATVVEEYGSTETGSLAGECTSGKLHLWADRAVFEVHDPRTGAISPEGKGQLVVTTLYREAMPLVRYDLEDTVEVSYEPCDCDWALPTIRVLGRTAFGYDVAGRKVNQHDLEEILFRLPERFGVLFWRARADADALRVQIEVGDRHREAASDALRAAIDAELGVPSEIAAVPPGTLVPESMLTSDSDVVKPRSLFGPGEDWDRALLYY